MKINPKIAKTPDELKSLEFKKMKGLIKKDLARLEKNTAADKPTAIMMAADFPYADVPKGVGLMLLGDWKGAFKAYAKNDIAKDNPMGAIGQAYFGGIDESGQKVVRIDLAKGKAKGKSDKLARSLKKLVPQATFNLVFGEMSEDAMDALEQRLDATPEAEEVFEEVSAAEEGEVEVANDQDVQKLLDSNLVELSASVVKINTEVAPRIKSRTASDEDADTVVDTLDLAQEWLELYNEAPDTIKSSPANLASLDKVNKIIAQVTPLQGILNSLGAAPTKTATEPTKTATENLSPQQLAQQSVQKGQSMLDTGKYNPGDGKTYCNFFAMDYVDSLTGGVFGRSDQNSPFRSWLKAKGDAYNTGCGRMLEFMSEKKDMFEEVTDFADAWLKHANNGKMVMFIDSGHVSTAAYTAPGEMITRQVGDKKYTFGKVIQAGKSIIKGDKYLNNAWSLTEKGTTVSKGVIEKLKIFIVKKAVQAGNTEPVKETVIPTTFSSTLQKGMKTEEVKVLQTALNKLGYGLGVDGDFGTKTYNAVIAVQAKYGLEQNGIVAPDSETWWAISGKLTTGGNTNNALRPEQIQLQYKGGATTMNAKAEAVLRDILAKAGEPAAAIVNTLRTPDQQASVMFLNLESTGAKVNRKMYKDKTAAGKVIDAYEREKAAGKTKEQIIGAMLAVGGFDKISEHCDAANPAIDIHPSSIKNKANFEAIIKADPRVAVICPPKDTTYHIKVK